MLRIMRLLAARNLSESKDLSCFINFSSKICCSLDFRETQSDLPAFAPCNHQNTSVHVLKAVVHARL